MPRVWCADEGCLYNNEHRCTAKTINLSWHSVETLWNGRKEFHRCRMRESPAEHRRKEREHENRAD